jgi:hypothetical protein
MRTYVASLYAMYTPIIGSTARCVYMCLRWHVLAHGLVRVQMHLYLANDEATCKCAFGAPYCAICRDPLGPPPWHTRVTLIYNTDVARGANDPSCLHRTHARTLRWVMCLEPMSLGVLIPTCSASVCSQTIANAQAALRISYIH